MNVWSRRTVGPGAREQEQRDGSEARNPRREPAERQAGWTYERQYPEERRPRGRHFDPPPLFWH
jgi:hypothetical protein